MDRKSIFILLVVISLLSFSLAVAQIKALMYHAHPSFGFTEASFTTQMDVLKENDYHTITLTQFYSWLTNAEPLPIRPILITFDDNYIMVYTVAYPILQARNFCAVNFAHTNYVGVFPPGGNDHCDWDEIQEMEDAGVFFTESHTRNHLSLPSLSDSQAWNEINGSKMDIEQHLNNKTCIAIAYPYGNYDSRIINFCQNAGYLMGFTTINNYNYRTTPPFELRRTSVGSENAAQFKQLIGFYDLPPAPPGEGWTIDNRDPNFFVDAGNWQQSTAQAGYYGNDYVYHTAGDGSSKVRWATYLPRGGTYRVYAWWTSNQNNASNAKYEIHHLGGITTITVNQKNNGGQWNLLDEFEFSTGIPAKVILSNDGDGTVIADGIWFEPVPQVTPTPTPTATPTPTSTPVPTPEPTPSPLIHYTFELNEEGWQFANEIPPFDMPMVTTLVGKIGLSPGGSTYCFSYWFSPEVLIENGKLYRSSWTVGSNVSNPDTAVQFRLRINQKGAWSAWNRVVNSNFSQAPDAENHKTYHIFFRPEVSGTQDNTVIFSFDILSFDNGDDVNSWLYLDELIVDEVHTK